jgi:glucose/arabinose dehydrogenase
LLNVTEKFNFRTMRVSAFFFAILLGYSLWPLNKLKKNDLIRLVPIVNIKFNKPVFMEQSPQNRNLFVIIEQTGSGYTINKTSGRRNKLFTLRGKVRTAGWEEGLLGFAFSPQYMKNKNAFIYYTASNPRRTILSRITLDNLKKNHGKNIDEEVILEQRQPFPNHNGGMIAFGPDKLLYIGLGDGGSSSDPLDYGQHNDSLLGTIIRIDVNTEKGYKIPQDNPFIKHKEFRKEIFAYGLRNPWRFSFDKRTGLLYVGDVGQNRYEEISIVNKGDNLGWAVMEGPACHKPKRNCKEIGKKPIHWYDHGVGRSIVGGYVYHGKKIPSMRGNYIFADTVSGDIFVLNPLTPKNRTGIIKTKMLIVSFAEDNDGEIYVLDHKSGKIYQLEEEPEL